MNYLGTYTLYMKEVRRFTKVYNQTLFAPVVNSLLFLAVFNLAMGDRVKTVGSINFPEFMACGLIIMAIMQNAFANTSSSLTMGKVMGTIIDYLMPPISAFEITCAMVCAGITRGIIVGILVTVSVLWFVPLEITHWDYTLFYAIMASCLMALLGMLAGIFAETFDQMAAVTSYVITPLAFLSGTFYSVHNLPPLWYTISQYNPFFYMIDGFRYGITGYHDGNIMIGMSVMLAITLILWFTVYTLLKIGYRIKQ